MNTNFMRLLAERLEHLCWIEVLPDDCLVLEFFDSMDGFFMSSDLKFWDRPPGFIFGDDDYFIGGVEDWAVQLIQERHGYYLDYEDDDDLDDSWVNSDIDDEFSEREVWLLACKALGLGEQVDGSGFVVDDDLAHALLRPSALHGRMRAVTPRMAAAVLRCCALGTPPQDAWAVIGQALRESRLRRLADVLDKTEAGVPVRKVVDWTYPELAANLTRFSMRDPGGPWVAADGAWCGDISLWAYKLYGATANLSFGPAAGRNVPLVSATFLGLTVMEGLALFEAGVSPRLHGELDLESWRRRLTPEMASSALRRVADGVFPSVAWDGVYQRLGLNALLDGTGMNGGTEEEKQR